MKKEVIFLFVLFLIPTILGVCTLTLDKGTLFYLVAGIIFVGFVLLCGFVIIKRRKAKTSTHESF